MLQSSRYREDWRDESVEKGQELLLRMNRRTFFQSMTAGFLGLAPAGAWGAVGSSGRTYAVRVHGAAGDGMTKDTKAVQRAIDRCAARGGGTVYFAPGVYRCGTLHLKSGVTLWLDNGAILMGSPFRRDYERYEELDFPNDADVETSYFRHALLFAEDAERIGIAGFGTIDCNFTRRGGPKAISLKRCRFVEIHGVRILNCPNYAISLLGTDFVNIDGVTILNGYADGIDPDSCRNVRISNCHIETVDDAIVPKASFSLGELRACENITVTNCYLSTRCNAFKLGTESGGDFKHITVSNCVMSGLKGFSPALSGVAIETVDGAKLEGVAVSNLSMVDVRAPIFLRLGNRGRDMEVPVPGTLRNVTVSDIVAVRASLACSIAGIPGHNIENVTLSNIRMEFIGGNPRQPSDVPVPELEANYPESAMFGPLPAYALFVRHVKNLSLSKINVSYRPNFWRLTTDIYRDIQWPEDDSLPSHAEPGQAGHALFVEHTQGLAIDGLRAQQSEDGTGLLRFHDVRGAQLRGFLPHGPVGTLLEVTGAASKGIHLYESALQDVQIPVRLLDGADSAAVHTPASRSAPE